MFAVLNTILKYFRCLITYNNVFHLRSFQLFICYNFKRTFQIDYTFDNNLSRIVDNCDANYWF